MTKEASQLIELISNSHNTVVVTGAGISTEAGIPDFRGENGIYRKFGENKIMNLINIDAFKRHTLEFYQFYRQYFMFPPVEPSKAHLALAQMEKKGYIHAIVTQNIDGLHQKAGSRTVIPIHGNCERFICMGRSCSAVYNTEYVVDYPEIIPHCQECGAVLKPDVVLFGEQIENYMDARQSILGSRLLIVIGSSLTVYPLAGFVREFSTLLQDLVIINKGHTALDHAARLKINVTNTGDLLEEVNQALAG